MRLRAATRGSPLARWQADHVAALLSAVDPALEHEAVVVTTTGDRDRTRPLAEIGGKGVFVKEVQAAVLDGRADLAVHSAKDLPSTTPDGLVIAAVPERADPRDALVGRALADLPPGSRIATGSARRRSQLAAHRPDLTFVGLRGNMDTRLGAAADHGAVVVAVAALHRLGRSAEAAEVLDPAIVLPQAGQGTLAVECRADDEATRALLAAIDHEPSHQTLRAERAFLAELGGDCDIPAGAYAVADGDGLKVEGLIASLDGHVVLRHTRTGADPEATGRTVARFLLDEAGGSAILQP
ncbi:MAG TPA: hydroxymethylbilane synthase [Actinomycetota bacterium]|nr:hydroxymethylbilane synthase [Actinomycetota bacterium]